MQNQNVTDEQPRLISGVCGKRLFALHLAPQSGKLQIEKLDVHPMYGGAAANAVQKYFADDPQKERASGLALFDGSVMATAEPKAHPHPKALGEAAATAAEVDPAATRWSLLDASTGQPVKHPAEAETRVLAAGATTATETFAQSTAETFGAPAAPVVLWNVAITGLLHDHLAATKAAKGVLVVEFSEDFTRLTAVTAKGIEGIESIRLGLGRFFDHVQEQLSLKFRGSAEKLFYEGVYDFTSSGETILADHLGPITEKADAWKSQLGQVLVVQPVTRSQWIDKTIAKKLGLEVFAGDLSAVLAEKQISLPSDVDAKDLSRDWFLACALATQATGENGQGPWQAVPAAMTPTPSLSEEAAAPAKEEPPQKEGPEKAKSEVAPAKPQASQKASVKKAAPAARGKKRKGKGNRPAAAAAAKPAPKPEASSPKEEPAKQPAAEKSPTPKAEKPAPDAPAVQEKEAAQGGKKGLIIGVIAAVLVLAVVAIVLMGGGGKDKAEPVAAKEEEESSSAPQPIKPITPATVTTSQANPNPNPAAEAANDTVPDTPPAEKQAPTKKTPDTSATAAADKTASKGTASASETEASAPAENTGEEPVVVEEEPEPEPETPPQPTTGAVVLVTDPSGASIQFGEREAKPSPLTLDKVEEGTYTVSVTMPSYKPHEFELEVVAGRINNPPVIELTQETGGLDLQPSLEDVAYTVREIGEDGNPASTAVREGTAPANLSGLVPGEYQVTYSKQPWPSHQQTVTVSPDETTTVSHEFPVYSLTINSTPEGAEVSRNGEQLGTTPMTVNDLPPGVAIFTIAHPETEPRTIVHTMEPDGQDEVDITLTRMDKVFELSEVDLRPHPVENPSPTIPGRYANRTIRARLQWTVLEDGTVSDVQVLESNFDRLNDVFVDAISQWRYVPAERRGRPVRTQLVQVFSHN